MGALALLMVLAGACSRQETARTLADRLRHADRVIVLNPDDGRTITIRGDLLKQLVQAIAAAPEIESEGLTATPSYTLVFYSVGTHLATVPTSAHGIFYIGNKPHGDKSETLRVAFEPLDHMPLQGSQQPAK